LRGRPTRFGRTLPQSRKFDSDRFLAAATLDQAIPGCATTVSVKGNDVALFYVNGTVRELPAPGMKLTVAEIVAPLRDIPLARR
jgi:hypothetical protein